MPGASRALPSVEGLDFSQISAAVGAVIFGNSTTGLLKNISLSEDIWGEETHSGSQPVTPLRNICCDLAGVTYRNHSAPRAHASGSVIERGHAANHAGRRAGG